MEVQFPILFPDYDIILMCEIQWGTNKSTVGIRAPLWPLLGTGRYNKIS